MGGRLRIPLLRSWWPLGLLAVLLAWGLWRLPSPGVAPVSSPTAPAIALTLAQARQAAARGAWAQVLTWLEQGRRASPTPLPGWAYALALQSSWLLGEEERANAWLQAALEAPLAPEEAEQLAHLAWSQRRWEAAIQLYRRAWEAFPEQTQVRWRLALLLAGQDPAQARELLRPLLEHPDAAWRGRAQVLDAALARSLAHQMPAYRWVEVGRGLGRLGYWELAERVWRRAVQLAPEYPLAWAYLGEALVRQEREAAAYQAWQAARKQARWEPLAYFLPGWYALRSGRPVEASAWLRRSVALVPHEPLFRYHLARALARQEGRFPQAWEQVLYLARLPGGRLLAARFTLEHQTYVETHGLPWIRAELLQNPQNPQALLLMGWAYMQLQDPDLSLRFLTRALQQDPQDPQIHRVLAWWYRWQGEEEQARIHEQRARELQEALP